MKKSTQNLVLLAVVAGLAVYFGKRYFDEKKNLAAMQMTAGVPQLFETPTADGTVKYWSENGKFWRHVQGPAIKAIPQIISQAQFDKEYIGFISGARK